jgi:dienelactone hydrolase
VAVSADDPFREPTLAPLIAMNAAHRLLFALGTLAVLLTASPRAAAQLPPVQGPVVGGSGGSVGGSGHTGGGSGSIQGTGPAERFKQDLSGSIPWPPHPDWGFLTTPEGAAWKFIGPSAGDPLLQLILPPGLSGNPTTPEIFNIQLPLKKLGNGSPPGALPGVIVGYHQFGVSQNAIHLGSFLPDFAAAYEMILIAPLGLSQINFGNLNSQASLQAVLEFIENYFPFDRDRIYGVGFSMGGLSAYANAISRQDPADYRFAGIATHMGTVDPIAEYNLTTPEVQAVLENDVHFGASPDADVFSWERALAGRGTPELVIDPDLAPIANLRDIRLHISVNLNDPVTLLLNQATAMASYVGAQGWGADLRIYSGPADHSWMQFDLDRALRFIFTGGPAPIDPVAPGPIEIYADDTGTRGVRRLAIDLDALPSLSESQPMTLSHFASDGVPITLELRDFDQAPSLVLVNGLAPLAWSYVAGNQTLRISPTDDGSFALIQVFP